MAAIASSSSSSAAAAADAFHPKKYDVFVSFRGEDTRRNFTSHLRDALRQKQIATYIDDRLDRGDEISPALFKAIEDSHISVIVFSENYASSKWCLDELVTILECRKMGQDVIPVFYNVDPSHVRKQSGSYKEAFAKLERDFKNNQDKLTKWKEALSEAANLAGWDSGKYGDESKLIHEIVKDVLRKLEYKYPPRESKCPFGINENIAPIELLLREVQTIGIWGMGGIGKTTIAKWLFDKYSSQYESSYFLPNIREKLEKHGQALNDLRNELVSKLLDEDERTTNVESTFVKRRLCRKGVFTVLDDVSTSKQLEYLVGELQHCGSGSRIIITTRDKHVLSKGVDKIHEVKVLNSQESLQLFSLKAFNQNHPKMGYEELSKRAVDYAKGVPLALEVLGSFLLSKTKSEWESALKKLKGNPKEEIQCVLMLSYDGLDYEEREIFLEIACFLKGDNKEHVIKLLNSYGFNAVIGLRTLQNKALITTENNFVWMHDLIQEMGREIVRQESNKEPGRRSRLWDPEEVYDVLKNNRGTDAIEGIILNMSQIGDLELSVGTFRNMIYLRFLKFYLPRDARYSRVHLPSSLQLFSDKLKYLQWDRYPSKSLPLTFCPKMLVELLMPDSHIQKLWDGVQDVANLKRLDLSGSRWLKELPDFSLSSNLEVVDLSNCESLCHVHPSILSLHSLVGLYLSGCKKLKSLESEIHLRSLEYLYLDDCTSLKKFLVWSEGMRELNLSCTSIECLPASIKQLTKLSGLHLQDCKKLQYLPELPQSISWLNLSRSNIECLPASIKQLTKLSSLRLEDCKKLQYLPELPQSISWLNLSKSNIECLPASIKQLTKLSGLYLEDCKKLQYLPELPQSISWLNLSRSNIECLPASIKQLTKLSSLRLEDCKKLQYLPELPQSISWLNLSRSNIECLPASIKQLTKLESLDLEDCEKLQYLPELPRSISLLNLSRSNIECLPASIKQLTKLSGLPLQDCKKLQYLPELPRSISWLDLSRSNIECLPASIKQLTKLSGLPLQDCKKLQYLPELPQSISWLDLSRSNIECLPASIKQLTKLSVLHLQDCKKLQYLPELPQSISRLNLCRSNIECLPASIKQLTKLSGLPLQDCKKLQYLPELPQSISWLNLSGSNIECLPASIKQLTKLESLDLEDCEKLQYLPELPPSISLLNLSRSNIECLPASIKQLTKLSGLPLQDCKKLQYLPELPQSISRLNLSRSNIECLPASFKQLTKLSGLDLEDCEKLQYLPELPQSISRLNLSRSNIECLPASIKQLTKLSGLRLEDCKKLQYLPELPQSISWLNLSGSNIECLPASIKQLTKLSVLVLEDCKKLPYLPEFPQSISWLNLSGSNIECLPASIKLLTKLRCLFLNDCKKLQYLPELPQSIAYLFLSGSNIECLPASIKQLTMLTLLGLHDCKRLRSLPELPQSIRYLDSSNCTSLETVITPKTSTPWKERRGLTVEFVNCLNLDEHARYSILEDSYSSIKQIAHEMAVGGRLVDYFNRTREIAWNICMFARK